MPLRLETETTSEQLRVAAEGREHSGDDARHRARRRSWLEGVPAGIDQQFRTLADQQTTLAFDRDAATGGGTHTFRMQPNIVVQRRAEAVTQAIQTIERRVNELGVSEPTVAPYGSTDNQILVQLPGLSDITRAKNIIGQTAMLELKLVEAGPAADQATLLQAIQRPGAAPTWRSSAAPTPGDAARRTTSFERCRR